MGDKKEGKKGPSKEEKVRNKQDAYSPQMVAGQNLRCQKRGYRSTFVFVEGWLGVHRGFYGF